MAETGSYPELIRQLGAARGALESEQAAALEWYEAQLVAAQDAVERADQLVVTAGEQVAAARAKIDRVDTEAALLWRALGARLGGRAAARLGGPPAPATLAESGTPGQEPLALLRRVRGRLDTVPARRVRPLWVTTLLWLLGIAGIGVLAFLVAAARLH